MALPTALYTNRRYLKADPDPDPLPDGDWVFSEGTALLDRSEDRLQSLESKGAGLATVCGVVAAAVAVAISLEWSKASTGARVLLVAAALYSAMSLWAPVKLVGPLQRATVTDASLRAAAADDEPEISLANMKARAAAANDRATLRLSNLQAASRDDVRNAILLFLLWGALSLAGVVRS